MSRKYVRHNQSINKVTTVIIGVGTLIVIAFLSYATEAESQRPPTIPIERYEFPQDGAVCYRTTDYYNRGAVALSCIKK